MKTLVMVRHAHRDTDNKGADNGLSERGKQQALGLGKHFQKTFSTKDLQKEKPDLISSPKLRCVETLMPIARYTKVETRIDGMLLERLGDEKVSHFHQRIEDFCKWWRKEAPADLTVICSHGDWLPVASEILLGTAVEFSKGCWAEVELVDGKPVLKTLIQDFD